MSEIKQDYDFYTYIEGAWQKLNNDLQVYAETVQYPITISQNNIDNITNLIEIFDEINQYLRDLGEKTNNEILEGLKSIENYENINLLIYNLDDSINSNVKTLFEEISDKLTILEEKLEEDEDCGESINELKSLIVYLISLDEEDFYKYIKLDEALKEKFEDIDYKLTNRYTNSEVNNLLRNKSNIADTYILNDLVTYVNNLNLTNNFPSTDILTLPSDKTLWAWLFNAMLAELRNKITNEDLEDLLSVSERRYYASSKDNLPDVGDSTILYFVLKDSTSTSNKYEEYIWVDNHYELLGTGNSTVDVSNFYNKLEIDTMIGDLQDYLNS